MDNQNNTKLMPTTEAIAVLAKTHSTLVDWHIMCTMVRIMDIRDVAKDTPNNIKIVQRAVDEQVRCLCLPEQAQAITATLTTSPTIERLVEKIEEKATTAVTRSFTANDMRMIAAYALAAAAWLDMDAADRGEGDDVL